MMKHLPTWKAIKAYVDGTPMVPEHCIVRDGYYLDMFDLDKLPKEDEGVQQNVMPELTWSRDDDYALGAVAMQINEARRKAVESGQDALAEQLKKSEDWLKLLEHRVGLTGGEGICRQEQQGHIVDGRGRCGCYHICCAGADR